MRQSTSVVQSQLEKVLVLLVADPAAQLPALVGLRIVHRVVGAHETLRHAAAVAHQSRALLAAIH